MGDEKSEAGGRRLGRDATTKTRPWPGSGYEKAAEVIKESTKTGRSIRELVLERGWMTSDELDKALDVLALTKGGITK